MRTDVDDVALFEFTLVRNAVANHLVHRSEKI